MSKKRMDMPVRFTVFDRQAIGWVQEELKTIGPWGVMYYMRNHETRVHEVGHSGWRIARNWEVAS